MPRRNPDGDASTMHLRKHLDTETRDAPATVTISRRRDATTSPEPMAALAAEPHAPPVSAPGERIGQYEIIRSLGRGGMGEVHLARDLRLGRLVAIKLLSERGGGTGERLLAEARATARCNHENIVMIHDVGEHAGRPYMVLEYVQGQTLSAWWGERTRIENPPSNERAGRAPLPPNLAVELMIPVVRALAYAHDMGIVHRDLKPSNIMLTAAGVIKVLDFGIAKLRLEDSAFSAGPGSLASESGAIVGTLPYMSPEQLTGEAVDHRTDLWAVGIMLFEMVTGTHPTMSPDGHLSPAALLAAASLDVPMPSVSERRADGGALGHVIDRCLIKNREHRTGSARILLQELEAVASSRRAMVVDHDENPFAGLAAFQESDADRFFGREHDIAALVAKLRSQPLVAVAGPSGTGKSSLVRAGVIPALKRSGEGWEAIVIRPGRQPMAALAEVLMSLPWHSSARHSGAPAGSEHLGRTNMLARLRAEPGYLGGELRAWARTRLRRMALFIDQFEELYTLGADAGERARFLACIDAVADDAASPLRVILTVRSDFLDRMVERRTFMEAVNRGLMFLTPLDRAGLRMALTRPVEAFEHRFEHADMVERILDELDTARGALPLLQFTAAKLWAMRDRGRRLLTEASLRELGGVAGALIGHADAVLAAMTAQDTRLARAVFLRLVTPERTRGLATLAELRQLGPASGDIGQVLGRLIDARLLAVDGGGSGGRVAGTGEEDGMVEIAHDSLIDTWPLLSRWLDESEDDAVFLARLRSAAKDWERGGHAAGLLWTGEAAGEAHAWRQRYQGELGAGEQRYLVAVFANAARSRRTRRRLFGGALSAAVTVALAMTWLAWQESEASRAATRAARRAEQEAVRAEREAVRARDATRMAVMQALPHDPTTQLALVREIEDGDAPPPGATRAAKRLLYAGVASAVLIGHEDEVRSASFSPDGAHIVSASRDRTVRVWRAQGMGEPLVLRGHDAVVRSASYSPDSARIVSASADKTVRVWRADGTGEPLVLRGHDGAVWSASFSPDGALIVSASTDKTMRVWRTDGTGEPLVLRGHDDIVLSASFSPDGARIVSASADKTVRVWRTDGKGEPLVLRGHDDGVWSASFSPDGTRVVSGSSDKTVRMWRADGTGEPLVLRGHEDEVWSASFSSDGTGIVSASGDKTVRVWRADGVTEPLVLRGHDDGIWSASFSPDGTRVVSASSDKTVRVWRVDGTDEPLVLSGDDAVQCASFSPDGTYIVSASVDKTVRVQRSDGAGEPLVLRGHDDSVWLASFSPDGTRILSASPDKTIRVWRTDATSDPLVLRGHDGVVVSASFSPDGTRVISASVDKTVRVWPADGTGEPLVLRGHDDGVWSASFSPDGTRAVSASRDKTVRVWRADGSGEPLVLRGHDDGVWSVSFSPDGTRIVSGSFDKTVRVWRADGTGEPLVLRGHDDKVSWVEFSPDGKQIVSASKDKTIRIWRADGTGEPTVLTGHTSWVNAARFSPDGRRIVSASNDQTVRVWHDLAPVTLDDPRLWTATTYCMSVERRVELLGVTPEAAERERQRCLVRVAQARGADSAQPRL